MRKDTLQLLHDVPTAGHLGITKTLARVKERFYWVGCHRDVENFCRSCDICASRRGTKRKPHAAMSQYDVGAPMERVAMDVLGPLPVTNDGNK